MVRALIPWTGSLVLSLACGGRAVILQGPPDGATDGSSVEAGADLDGGTINLPPCREQMDCFGAQSCQQGYCCAGVMTDGVCRCGDGAGCDIQNTCCTNKMYPKATCVPACGLDPPGPPDK